jgi:hypothetical protein
MLNSNGLEKRIQGIKTITEQIKDARAYQKERQRHILGRTLVNLNILESVFASGKFHLQIVQRAGDLVKIYAQDELLTEQ